jgi:FkbM family methyltransferase
VRINHIKNVQLIEAGVSDKSGTTRFDVGLGTGRGHIGGNGGLAIDIVSLDDLCASGKVRPPNLIKMDIEGEETKALRGAKQTLSSYRPIVLISLHGDEARQQCPAILESLGYKVQWLGRSDILATA